MSEICKTKLMSFKEGYAENNRVKIFYRDYGPADATPILLVHGLGAQLVHWPDHLIDFLIENGLRPITFDNRDAGLSSRFTNKPSIVLGYLRYFFRLPIKPEYSLNDMAVSYTHLRAHETGRNLVCRLLLEKKKPRNNLLMLITIHHSKLA